MKTIEAYQFVMCAYVDNYTVEPFHCLLASHIWIPYGEQNKTVLINRVLPFQMETIIWTSQNMTDLRYMPSKSCSDVDILVPFQV